MESVAAFAWNGWQASSGISGNLGLEYAAAGENPEWIARQMGHTTTEMLFRVYSRYVPNLTRRDGSAFERLLINEFEAKVTPEEEAASDEV